MLLLLLLVHLVAVIGGSVYLLLLRRRSPLRISTPEGEASHNPARGAANQVTADFVWCLPTPQSGSGCLRRGQTLYTVENLAWVKMWGLRMFFNFIVYMCKTGWQQARVDVLDARKLMKESGLSKAEFFDRYGFVLLDHKTAMQPSQWHVNTTLVSCYGAEVRDLFHKEIAPPSEALMLPRKECQTRGPPLPGRKVKGFYGSSVVRALPRNRIRIESSCSRTDGEPLLLRHPRPVTA